MAVSVGDRIPDATLVKIAAEGPQPVSTADFFAGRTVALFAVPGAFTPTCSAKHLPGFVEHAQALKDKGIDEIACVSVNDAFVMAAWGKSSGVEGKVTMLADGNGSFAEAMGLVLDATGFGMGKRSQRYSLVAKDGVITHLFVEEGGQFQLSSAEHMLGQV
ncbi:MAG: peroxiredoxin [Thermaurantiacus sp.]